MASDKDHDLLTRIDANLSSFMQRFEDHTAEDKTSFEKLEKAAQNSDKRLTKVEWIAAGGLGVLATIEFYFKIFVAHR